MQVNTPPRTVSLENADHIGQHPTVQKGPIGHTDHIIFNHKITQSHRSDVGLSGSVCNPPHVSWKVAEGHTSSLIAGKVISPRRASWPEVFSPASLGEPCCKDRRTPASIPPLLASPVLNSCGSTIFKATSWKVIYKWRGRVIFSFIVLQ